MNDALKSSKELAMVEELCSKKKISLTSTEKSSISSYASSYMSTYTGFSSNGISQKSLERTLQYSALYLPKLIQAYYGKSGEHPVSDADLLAYYNSNFADIKQILISSNDDSGNALTGDKLKAAEATANEVYKQLSADHSKYSSLESTYDYDKSGAQSYPQGYIFAKDNTQYIQVFTNAAFEMKVNEVKMVQSSYGWHIMYRVPNDTSASVYNDTQKAEVLQDMKKSDMMKIIDSALAKAKVVKNNSMLNHYSPKKLKDS